MTEEYLNEIEKLRTIWDKSFINAKWELILEAKRNIFIVLKNYHTPKELKLNMLEYKSRPCVKGDSAKVLNNFRKKFNKYFDKDWSKEEIELIYQRLGNGVNHKLCEEFLDSNFNLKLLRGKNENN